MMKFITNLLAIIAVTISATPAIHAADNIDSYREQLAKSTTTADSVTILYNIYDLSSRATRGEVAWQMLDIAERTHNDSLGLNILRYLANTYTRNDSILALLQQKCSAYPDNDDRAATETFIALRRAGYIARYGTENNRLAKIKETVNKFRAMENTDTLYRNIQLLGTICILIGIDTHTALSVKYIDKAVELTQSLPETDFAVRNIIYNQAANVYTNLNLDDKAIAIDRELIKIMDRMSARYNAMGRPHRKYDAIRYTTYRNMLQNYDALSSKEIEQYYDSIKSIAARNTDVAADMRSNLTQAFYLMASKKYHEAIPLLKEVIAGANDNFIRMRALRNIITAAQSIGDHHTALTYTGQYNAMLEEYIKLSALETYNELRIIYDVNELQMANARLELDHAETKVKHQRLMLIGGIIILLILLTAICILAKHIRKSNKLAASLAESNKSLKIERSNLLATQKELIEARDNAKRAEQCKAEFIDNMSSEITTPLNAIVEYSHLIVDCSENSTKKYLQRYADIVKLNTELLNTIVHDILDVRVLEQPNLSVKRMPALVGEMCHMAVESVRPHLQKGVTIGFDRDGEPDFYITTDARRVEQVLINLLSNSAKFTSSGHISLSYSIDHTDNSITFAVTDSGSGIPKGKEEEIFDRFRKLDRDSQGSGLGLSICRMIANVLGGTVKVDPTYTRQGARFIFTIPTGDASLENEPE